MADSLNVIRQLLFLSIFFLPVIVIFIFQFNREEKEKVKIQKYMIEERNNLIQTAYPNCRFFFPDRKYCDYLHYNLRIEKNYENCVMSLNHSIERHEGGSDDYDVYYNYITINRISKNEQYMLFPAQFETSSSCFSLLKCAEKIGEAFATAEKVEIVRQTRTSDIVTIGTSGKVSYREIPKYDWDRLVSMGLLDEIERLLTLWNGVSSVKLRYSDRTLRFEINERANIETEEHRKDFQCFRDDIIVKQAYILNHTMDILDEIADILASVY